MQLNDSWKVYYHHDINNWKIDGYRQICEIKTIQDFWNTVSLIDRLGSFTQKHYFIMRHNVLPLWEDKQNYGSWSIKLNISDLEFVWNKLIKYILGETLIKENSKINGISINVKNNHTCIVKIWTKKLSSTTTDQFPKEILNICKYTTIYKEHKPEW